MEIKVIGAGLAGSEAAYYLAERGYKVALYEIKPKNLRPRILINALASWFAPTRLKVRTPIPMRAGF